MNVSGPPPGSRCWRRTLFVLFSTLLVVALGEWEHYRKTIGWNAFGLSAWDKVVLAWSLWAKSLALFLPLLVTAEGLTRLGWRRTAQGIWVSGATILLFWLVADLRVQAVTGNHVSLYFQFLLHPSTWTYGGGGGAAGFVAQQALLGLGVLALALLLLDWLCRKHASAMVRRWTWLDGGRGAAAALGVVLMFTLGVAPAQAFMSCPLALERLYATLPCNFTGLSLAWEGHDELDRFRLELSRQIRPVFEQVHERMLHPPATDAEVAAMPRRPHIVVLLLESLRHDALELMPRVKAWSENGLRLERHFAGANCSHLGVFALVHARHPLVYFPTLDAGVKPQACASFQHAGYECSFITSGTTQWQRMGDYLNTRHFDRVEEHPHNDPTAGDVVLTRRIRHLLRSDKPQFIVAFFMSTHFPYCYPRAFERHLPVLDAGRLLGASPAQRPEIWNRYRNSAAFLDHELGELLAEVDPRQTWVLFTGDHGESFFEDGTLTHCARLSDVQTRVPCALVGQGIAPGTVTGATAHCDLLPTLLHGLTGRPVALRHVHGRDLLAQTPEDHVLLGSATSDGLGEGIMVRGKDRLGFTMTMEPKELRVIGFFDDAGRFDPTHRPTPSMAEEWSAVAADELGRLAR
jgi:membrane-anchored protein YejM (alkaline phosphatase superfamily)